MACKGQKRAFISAKKKSGQKITSEIFFNYLANCDPN